MNYKNYVFICIECDNMFCESSIVIKEGYDDDDNRPKNCLYAKDSNFVNWKEVDK